MPSTALATRQFSLEDQQRFAVLTGDRNPLHLDPLAARRTPAGAPVVHGVHAALWALEVLEQQGCGLRNARSIRVKFNKFIYLHKEVSVRATRSEPDLLKAEAACEDLSALGVTVKLGSGRAAGGAPLAPPGLAIADGAKPARPSLAEMTDCHGWLAPPAPEGLAVLFPALARAIGAGRIAALGQLSRLVGMVCPGLHSIFESFSVDFTEEEPSGAAVSFRTRQADPRLRLVSIRISGGGIGGEVRAFIRPEPVESAAMSVIGSHVLAGEFVGRTALVVGGSRGLGAVTAKLVAAGGGRVVATYATGRDDAAVLAEEINAACGPRSCVTMALDVRGDIEGALSDVDPGVTDLFYFASPHIAVQKTASFSFSLFNKFCEYYLVGFDRVARHLISRPNRGRLSVLYPSTVFVTERPVGMTEYAMAKAAGELLCADLARSNRNVEITAPRLPRLATDQTSSIEGVPAADPVEVLPPLIRGRD